MKNRKKSKRETGGKQTLAREMVERAKKPAAISATHDDAPQPQVSISDDSSRVIARLPTGESVEVHLHGATVISWKSNNGRENLWLSEKAVLDGSKPIRGGIPVVFPVSMAILLFFGLFSCFFPHLKCYGSTIVYYPLAFLYFVLFS